MIAAKSRRRKVHYNTLEEMRLDIDFFAQHEYVTVGNWTYSQILTHLYRYINASFDGYPFLLPTPLRRMLHLARKPILRYSFVSGFKIPKKARALEPIDADDLETALDRIHDAIYRLGDHVPGRENPVLGHLTYDEWIECHLRHAELHMSFVIPASGEVADE
ncbi:MAG: hypothetical protein CMJ46_06790 [Planctomyces sp.]|nr:hypothetical protein [Planctomyces sp.]